MEAFAVASAVSAWKFLTAAWIRKRMLGQFEHVGTVADLIVYPVKGCGGNHLDEAICGPHGVEIHGIKDRDLMIIEMENGMGFHRNMKQFPSLVYVTASLSEGQITLTAPGMDPISIPTNRKDFSQNRLVKCNLHGDIMTVVDAGAKVSAWLKSYMKTDGDIRLVYPIDKPARRRSSAIIRPWDNSVSEHDEITFQYFSPYHITNTKSLEDLNSRLVSPVPMDNFRPGIIIQAQKAFQEDEWIQIRIGDKLVFRCQEPCLRCVITGLTHDKSKAPAQNDVLRTLRKYRQQEPYGSSPVFGIYAAIDENVNCRVRVGDPVYAIRRRT